MERNQEKIIYEYSTLRYVPDIERGEFVNIGLMMMCKQCRWHKVKLHIDEQKIKAMRPDADIDRLRCQASIFTSPDVPARDLPEEEKYRWKASVKSAIIQTSPSHPGLIIVSSHLQSTETTENKENLRHSTESPTDKLNRQFRQLFDRLVK